MSIIERVVYRCENWAQCKKNGIYCLHRDKHTHKDTCNDPCEEKPESCCIKLKPKTSRIDQGVIQSW